MCRPKEEEGFGMLDLQTLNMALMVKWWWRRLSNPQEALQKILVAKYERHSGSWHLRPRNSYNTYPFRKGVLISKGLF